MNYDIIFDVVTMEKYLYKLPNKFFAGPNGKPSILLKKLATKLSLPLSLIFQTSFNKGVIPNEWKQVNVPIFKGKGSKHIIDNYRPIGLTSTTCMVMESITHNNFVDYCDRNNILSDEQHGLLNYNESFRING